MNNLTNKQKFITGTVTLILIGGAIFLPMLFINSAIFNFYRAADRSNFVSNNATISDPNFPSKAEIEVKKFDLFNPTIVVFYKANHYKSLDHAVIADFIYLQRTSIIGWRVAKYESSYLPFYDGQATTFDQLYQNLKKQVNSGK